MTDRPRVVLPQPLSPTIASVSPRLIDRVTSSTAFNGIEPFSSPRLMSYHFRRLWSSMMLADSSASAG